MYSRLICLPPSSLCPVSSRLPDLSSYGDGLVWGAALLLHSLGQTAHFKLTDLTTLLLESHQLGWRSTSLHLTSTPTADSCLSWSMSSHDCMFAAHCCLSSSNVNPQLCVMKMLLTSSGYVQLLCRSCFKTQNLLSPVDVVTDYLQQRLCILQGQTQTGKTLQLLSQGHMPQKASSAWC